MVGEYNLSLNNYIQMDKVDHLYRQTVDRIEKQIVELGAIDKNSTFSSQIGLGKLLGFLGLDFSLTGNLGVKSAKSIQVISELAPEQKLGIVIHILVKEKLLFDLNECLQTHKIVAPNSIVSFRSGVKFQFYDLTDKTYEGKIEAIGAIGRFKIKFLCSRKYFISDSSVELDINEGIERDIEGIASVKELDFLHKIIFLNPVYF